MFYMGQRVFQWLETARNFGLQIRAKATVRKALVPVAAVRHKG